MTIQWKVIQQDENVLRLESNEYLVDLFRDGRVVFYPQENPIEVNAFSIYGTEAFSNMLLVLQEKARDYFDHEWWGKKW